MRGRHPSVIKQPQINTDKHRSGADSRALGAQYQASVAASRGLREDSQNPESWLHSSVLPESEEKVRPGVNPLAGSLVFVRLQWLSKGIWLAGWISFAYEKRQR